MMRHREKTINPLNVLKIRKVEFCPPYFETITIELTYNLSKALNEWIFDNLSGRYYIGDSIGLQDNDFDKKIHRKIKVGFENSKEMSYFMLACPLLKYNK
jgi:hypothetical protein